MDIGAAVSSRTGVSNRQIAELFDFETSDAFSETERAVLRLASAMTATPGPVPRELIDALRRELTERQIVELVSIVAWENYRSRFNRAFGVAAEGYAADGVCVIPHARS